MLDGLDLFSGIGGLTIAMSTWTVPVAYCERDRYCQAVLLQRMSGGDLPRAPIWDDIRSLSGEMLPKIDFIYGGFPCQDISVAGSGKGLGGKRSGLFWELRRLVKEIHPGFVFLENVPAIRTRGLREIARAFAELRYDARWTCVSAREVGAPHLRKRWFMLARSNATRGWNQQQRLSGGQEERICDKRTAEFGLHGKAQFVANTDGTRSQRRNKKAKNKERKTASGFGRHTRPTNWWEIEPDVDRVVDGIPLRAHRIKCLGNAVVPLQAKEAFKRLM